MNSTGEEEAVASCGKVDIKEEPILTDNYKQPYEEIEQIYIKEESVKLEIPGDIDANDPLQVRKEECMAEEEATSPPDVSYVKEELELLSEEESTTCGSEAESIIPTGVDDDNSTDGRGNSAPRVVPSTGTDIVQHIAFSKPKSGIQPPVHSCTSCKKTFTHLQALKTHQRVDSCKLPHSCSVCHKTLKSSLSLKIHFRQHTGERPYSCDVCQKTFTTSSSLKVHSIRHTGERPHACGVCQKTFICRGSLFNHYRLHTGERPYICHVCQKTFTRSTNLEQHSRVHTGVYPFTCEVCPKTFISRYNLKQHSRVHNCAVCHKTFTERCKHQLHLRLHERESPYSCSLCQKKFTRLNFLKRHIQMHKAEAYAIRRISTGDDGQGIYKLTQSNDVIAVVEIVTC